MWARAVLRRLTSPRVPVRLIAATLVLGALAGGRPAKVTTDNACSTLAARLDLVVDALVADIDLETSQAEASERCRAKCGKSRDCKRCDKYDRTGTTWKDPYHELRREAAELQIVYDGHCRGRERAR